MKLISKKLFISMSLVTTLVLVGCKKNDNSSSTQETTADVKPAVIEPAKETKNIITEEKSYTSEDLSIEASTEAGKTTGSVFFIKKDSDMKGVWGQYDIKSTALEVEALNEVTKEKTKIILTAYRDNACGFERQMNDGITCPSDKPDFSSLIIKYEAAKNPKLENGLYTGSFEILAKGWHNPKYEKVLPIEFKIENKLANVITANKPFVSKDLSLKAETDIRKSSVYFLINDLKPIWGVDQYKTKGTDFKVLAQNGEKSVQVTLTGYRSVGTGVDCGILNMNDGAICYNNFSSVLNVKFDAAKNPGLEAGLYTAKFDILAKGWHSDYAEKLNLELAVEIKK